MDLVLDNDTIAFSGSYWIYCCHRWTCCWKQWDFQCQKRFKFFYATFVHLVPLVICIHFILMLKQTKSIFIARYLILLMVNNIMMSMTCWILLKLWCWSQFITTHLLKIFYNKTYTVFWKLSNFLLFILFTANSMKIKKSAISLTSSKIIENSIIYLTSRSRGFFTALWNAFANNFFLFLSFCQMNHSIAIVWLNDVNQQCYLVVNLTLYEKS